MCKDSYFHVRFYSFFGENIEMAAIFEGKYQQFNEIPDADTYDAANIIPRIYEHSVSRYQIDSFFPEPIPNEYNHIRDITSLCISLLCAERKGTINILDIGGGFAVSYIELLKRCTLQNYFYTVCEIDVFCQHYQAHSFLKEKNICFINSLEKIVKRYDLVLFGSSLQYFSNYSETLADIIQRAQFPEYILMTHTPVTSYPTFATAQVNMDNKKIPNWIFNIDSLGHVFLKNGYSCLFRSAISRAGVFDDFKEEYVNYRSANLLFKKQN